MEGRISEEHLGMTLYLKGSRAGVNQASAKYMSLLRPCPCPVLRDREAYLCQCTTLRAQTLFSSHFPCHLTTKMFQEKYDTRVNLEDGFGEPKHQGAPASEMD